MQEEFTLTNTQIGLIGSALGITWAISGPLGGLSVRQGSKQKNGLGSFCSTVFGLVTHARISCIFWDVTCFANDYGIT